MLKLTTTNYWEEIEATAYSAAVKGCLKGIVNAHIDHVVPPQITPAELGSMRKSGPKEILLTRPERCGGYEEFLMVMHYIPNYDFVTHERGREFLYLAKGYPNGTNIQLSGA